MYIPNLCPAHNFVIWSQILKLFHRNDHHIEKTCHAQHLGRYLEGQGHSMTLQQNCVRPITLLLEVWYNNYFTEMITILRQSVTCHILGASLRSRSQHDLAAKLCLAHNFVIWSLILLLFHRNDHHIETMCCAQHLGCFYTLNFVCDITLTLQEIYLPVSKTYSGSITRFKRLLFELLPFVNFHTLFLSRPFLLKYKSYGHETS
jgi:hypothetical protein